MKHTTICGRYLWIAVVVGGILTGPLSFVARSQDDAGERVGSVIVVRGKVEAIDASGVVRVLGMKSPILRGDTIKTGPRGRVQMSFVDNTVISLGQKTEMVIEEYRFNPTKSDGAMLTRVNEGVFRVMGGAITKIAPDKFKTETPSATIGIRGSFYAGRQVGNKLVVVFLGGRGITVGNSRGRVTGGRHGIKSFRAQRDQSRQGC